MQHIDIQQSASLALKMLMYVLTGKTLIFICISISTTGKVSHPALESSRKRQ